MVVSDATDGYSPLFKQVSLEMVTFSDASSVLSNLIYQCLMQLGAGSVRLRVRFPITIGSPAEVYGRERSPSPHCLGRIVGHSNSRVTLHQGHFST